MSFHHVFPNNQKSGLLAVLTFVTSLAAYYLTANAMHFQVALNDFWTVFYYAQHLNITQLESLHNPLFPIGYATILHFFPVQHALWLGFYLNIFLASITVTANTSLASFDKKWLRALIVAFVTIFNPLTFQYANTIGPDAGVATFMALGFYFVWLGHLQERNPSQLEDILAGAALGFATLWRSHAVVAAVAFLVAYIIVTGTAVAWQRKWIVFSFLAVAGIQVLVNVMAGHGIVDNAQFFNIYKTFFGNNWLVVPKEQEQNLLLNLIINRPWAVIKEFTPFVWEVLIYSWPAALLRLVSNKAHIKKFALFAFLTILFYAVPVALGSSPRAPIAITALSFVSFGFLISEGIAKINGMRWRLSLQRVLAGLFLLMGYYFIYTWYEVNTSFVHQFADQHERFLRIEKRLINKGLTSPDQVFMNGYNFYLPTTAPYYPRFNGGWDSSVLWNFRTEYPELPVGSWPEFSAACKAQGIRFLVFNPYSYELAPFFGDLYEGRFLPEDVTVLGKIGNYQVLMFK